ncbi:MAG: sigma-54 dependent transcriptional regulator [Syntrophobacteraceae bacterium]|nr:sigma-54 dependent transcriptional regulator [Syntrophobacteraceae bacterium]
MGLKPKILIADDEPLTLELVVERLQGDYDIEVVSCGKAAIAAADKCSFKLVLTDLWMPDINGMEVLAHFVQHYPDTPVIVLTGFGTIETAVEAIKRGAYDYLSKPANLDEIALTLKRALEHKDLKDQNVALRTQILEQHRLERLIGQSVPMQKLYGVIKRVAKTDSTILITGESGTGKELIANAIHYQSPRCDMPFVPINCGAIPEELLESELFGHEKGAFTGAFKERRGRFELANKGTVFLDEIGEMSPKLQVKLLRFLQETKFQRVGGSRTIEVDVRILAATNKDLERAVAENEFREDLFYRLNVIPIHVPPLRERAGDVALLIRHFLIQHCQKKNIVQKRMSNSAIESLKQYDWPGNVRELENVIERLVILTDADEIDLSDLPKRMQAIDEPVGEPVPACIELGEAGINLKEMLENLENRLILDALHRTGGVKNKAAKLLGLNRTTLIEKMKKKQLDYPIAL